MPAPKSEVLPIRTSTDVVQVRQAVRALAASLGFSLIDQTKVVTAARLMGAEGIVSGIRPQIAQTIVHLGVDLQDVITKASLADAFALALQRRGLKVARQQTPGARAGLGAGANAGGAAPSPARFGDRG